MASCSFCLFIYVCNVLDHIMFQGCLHVEMAKSKIFIECEGQMLYV